MSDGRPLVWVGHAILEVPDVEKSYDWFQRLGMRPLSQPGDHVGILELRGGTHLVLTPGGGRVAATPAPFDLMVEDLDAAHATFAEEGLDPSRINEDGFHRSFTLIAPSGHEVTINSNHVSGAPV